MFTLFPIWGVCVRLDRGSYVDRSGNAAANRLEAAIARIARREGDPHDNRERAQRIKRDILVARRLRGGLAPALKHAWGEPVD